MSLSATVSRHHGLAVAKAARFKLEQAAPVATVAELANYDAIAVGAPTRFGRSAPTSRLTRVKLHGGMIGIGTTLAFRGRLRTAAKGRSYAFAISFRNRRSWRNLRLQPQTAFWRIARFGEGTSADLHDKSH